MLLGMLGKEHNHPPAFPQGQPNMDFIDQPLQQGEGAGDNPSGRYQYYTQAAFVDYQVGRLLDYLDNHHLTDSTLVIFASDHGTELFDHGELPSRLFLICVERTEAISR
jgi:arylsulfatase A-like enzyme